MNPSDEFHRISMSRDQTFKLSAFLNFEFRIWKFFFFQIRKFLTKKPNLRINFIEERLEHHRQCEISSAVRNPPDLLFRSSKQPVQNRILFRQRLRFQDFNRSSEF